MHRRFTIIISAFLAMVSFISVVSFRQTPVEAAALPDKFNMTYIFYGKQEEQTQFVDDTKGALNEVAVNYFNLNSNGVLVITDMNVQFIEAMHRRSIKVVAFLSNHWDNGKAKKALARPDKLAQEISDAVYRYNLDGVNIDIENINESDRASLTLFIKLLREKLPANRSLSVAVAVNPFGRSTGWAGAYDYGKLAQYSDYLMLMAYDESYAGSAPGPTASHKFVEDSIKYAVSQAPAGKIVLGIPFYGRYWMSGASKGGDAMTLNNIEKMLKQFNGILDYNSFSQTMKAVVTVPNGKYFMNGSIALGAGTYTIWYDSEQAIKNKLTLITKYGLKGVGSWSLGQESDSMWDYFTLWLNGIYYDDIQDHWARQHITALRLKGMMIGTSKNLFSPNKTMTRAEAATLVLRMLGLENAVIDEPLGGTSFEDMKGHWAMQQVEIAKFYGLVTGQSDSCFMPDAIITREDLAVMLDRILIKREGDPMDTSFRDVSPDSEESYEAIARMIGKAVIMGYSDGTFRPQEEVNRGQAASIINRMLEFIPGELLTAESLKAAQETAAAGPIAGGR